MYKKLLTTIAMIKIDALILFLKMPKRSIQFIGRFVETTRKWKTIITIHKTWKNLAASAIGNLNWAINFLLIRTVFLPKENSPPVKNRSSLWPFLTWFNALIASMHTPKMASKKASKKKKWWKPFMWGPPSKVALHWSTGCKWWIVTINWACNEK